MKKNYTLFLLTILSVFAFQVNAQTTLTHSASQTVVLGNTVACPTETTNFLRVFDLVNDFNIGADIPFEITEIQFGVEVSETQPITLNLYTADSTDPTVAALNNIYTASVPVVVQDEGTVISHTLTTPVTLDPMSILVVELAESADGIVFRVGSNQDGQTGPSWLTSAACGSGTVESFGFTNHFVINVVGNEILDLEDFSLSQVSLTPNPTNGIITIKSHNANIIESVSLYDVTGKKVFQGASETIDLTAYKSGVYLMRIKSERGEVTKRVVRL